MRTGAVLVALAVGLAGARPKAAETLRRYPRPDLPGEAWAVRTGGAEPLLYTGPVLPRRADGGFDADPRAQAVQAISNLHAVLEAAGCGPGSLVRINVCVVNDAVSAAVDAAAAVRLADAPAVFTWVRSPIGAPGALLALDGIAIGPAGAAAVRPVAAGVRMALLAPGERFFLSGEAEREKGVRASVLRAMRSLARDMGDLGLAASEVVQVKAVLKPYEAGRRALEQALPDFFPGVPPPVVVVEGGPENSAEIEMTAGTRAGAAATEKPVAYRMYAGHRRNPVYSDVAIVAPGTPLLFTAGIEGGAGDPRSQAEEAFLRLSRILFLTGGDYSHLIKSTAYYVGRPMDRAMNAVRRVYYAPDALPASTATDVAGVGRPGRSYLVDMILAPAVAAPK